MPKRVKDTLKWVQWDIEIAVPWQQEPPTVKASCLGPFGLHPTQAQTMPLKPSVRKFTLTHVPSGLSLLYSNSESDLRKIAFYLAHRFGSTFALKTAVEIRKALPPEVYEWLRTCYRAGQWQEPPQLSDADQPSDAD